MLALRSGIALLVLIAALPAAATEMDDPFASGVVFHDRNSNGARDAFDFGVRGVAVSNGRDVVQTDWRGRYRIAVGDDTILFVIKPGGWASPVDENGLPRFYYIHKPEGSPTDLAYPGVSPTGPLPDQIDFPLHRQREPRTFRAILFADPQPRTLEELDLFNRDIIEEVIGTEAAFGMTLGDLVGDDLSLFEPLNQAIADETGIKGKVLRGPIVPGPTIAGESDEAPFHASFSVVGSKKVVARFESDENGNFKVLLPPGEYTIVPDASAPIPYPKRQTRDVTVPEDGFADVTLRFDTGMR